jgi:uncharacterized protein
LKTSLAMPAATVLVAALLWFGTFYLTFSTFWIKITVSSACLALIALRLPGSKPERVSFDRRGVALGIISAVILYGVFWVGKAVSTRIFPFAAHQIESIYGKGEGTPVWIIFLLLLLVTGPCEEIYWRGYLQRNLSERFGGLRGWVFASAIYAAVHIWSFNFMLIGAAGVAGAFWGAIYQRTGRLAPVIVSHSLWSAVVFTLAPFG